MIYLEDWVHSLSYLAPISGRFFFNSAIFFSKLFCLNSNWLSIEFLRSRLCLFSGLFWGTTGYFFVSSTFIKLISGSLTDFFLSLSFFYFWRLSKMSLCFYWECLDWLSDCSVFYLRVAVVFGWWMVVYLVCVAWIFLKSSGYGRICCTLYKVLYPFWFLFVS